MNGPAKKIWIGTSGFSYPDWVGPFYPPGTRPGDMLAIYARRFPIVELNFSFYRMPSPGAFEHMVQRTPAGFQFLVKMSSDVTHALQLGAVRPFLAALQPLQEAKRLAGVLCQFPQSFHRTRLATSYLRQLADRLAGSPSFVEFRHRSWFRGSLIRELMRIGLGVVSVDVPSIPSLFPRELLTANGTIYVRFHSRRAGNWYARGKDRYDYLYSDEELSEWLDEIQPLLADTQRVYLLFNNCRKAQAAQNAEQVKRLIDGRPQLLAETTETNLSLLPSQLSLFSPKLRSSHADQTPHTTFARC